MTFSNVHMLYLIWLVPGVAALFVWGASRRRRILADFASGKSRASILPEKTTGRRRLKAVLMVASVLFLIIALAGPRYGYVWQNVERKGVDIVVALDCSKSMLAEDVAPSRLERAKREIIDLLAMLEGDRIGLVAFAGEAFLQCPLTLDYGSFNIFLDALTPDYLPVGGTDLAGALAVSMKAFKADEASEKAIILITDGEKTSGDTDAVAKKAAEMGIKVFSIGVGSKEGVPVPDPAGGFQKNTDGSILLSRLDADTLKRMADVTGGRFVRSVAGDMDLDAIYSQGIRQTMEARSLESSRKKVWEDRYQWFLGLSVICLAAYLGLGDVRKNGAALLLFLVLLMPRPARALELASPLEKGVTAYESGDYEGALNHFIKAQLDDPANPEIDFNIGTAYYRLGKFDEAEKSFERVATSGNKGLRSKGLYNLGNSRFKKGEIEKAIKTYDTLLKETPKDKKTSENRDFAKKALEQKKKQPQDPKGQGDKEKKEGKDGDPKGKGDSQQGSQNQDQNKKEGQNPDQKNQDPQKKGGEGTPPQDSKGQEPPGDQPPPPAGGTEGDSGQQPPSPAPETGEGAAGAKGKSGDAAMQQAASVLNRLKDKPGGAMMRRAEKRRVEKDW